MKKNYLFGLLSLFTMLFTVSCSEDELVDAMANTDVVTFNVTTEQVGTRAANTGEGAKANKLYYGVYENVNNTWSLVPAISKHESPIEMPATGTIVELRLAKQKQYSVIFWAENADGSLCDVDWANRSLKVNQSISANAESYDAFWGYDVITVTGAQKKEVSLVRPFAQLNIGVSDADWNAAVAASVELQNSAVTVKKVPTTMSLVDGTVGDFTDDSSVTYTSAAIPSSTDWTFPVAGNKYLALNYVLVGTEQSLVDVELAYTDKEGGNYSSTFTSVPVRRNYRTNIYGNLLTSDADYSVKIEAGLSGTEAEIEVWDGKTVTQPNADANNVICITNAAEFVGLMETTGNSIFSGKTIELQCNIDLANNTVKGIGGNSNFAGIFNGNGYFISNFTIDATDRSYYAGLFNQVSHGGTVKNLTIKNATIKGNSMVGAVASSVDSQATVENCKAINCTLIGVKKVGSVVGYSAGSTVKDCYAEKCVIEYSEKEAGEVLGFENTGSTVSGNTFKDITFKASAAALAKEMAPDANGVINIAHDYNVVGDWTSQTYSGTITINGNGHTINGLNKPLLAGNAANILTVNGLTIANSEIGKAANENGMGTGAFICYMDATNSVSFNDCHLIDSKVTGNERAGGLIGYSSATTSVSIESCSVEESEITAVGGSAGFVAYSQTPVSITNSKVTKSTVEATEDRTGKLALAGAVIGTVNANTTLTDVTVEGNTVKNTGATAYSDMIGRVVTGILTIDGNTFVSSQTALSEALKSGATAINLAKGNYDLSGLTYTADNVVIEGMDKDGCVVTVSKQLRADNKNLTLKNLTTDIATGKNYTEHEFGWIHHFKNFSMVNCKSNGRIRLNCYAATIEGCEFNVTTSSGFDGYAIFYYGTSNSTVKVSDCKFNTAGKAIVLYNEGNPVLNLDVDKCTFTSSNSSTDKAAIQMHTEYGISGTVDITNSTATGFANVNSGLWNELNNNTKVPTDNFEITVDGSKVH